MFPQLTIYRLADSFALPSAADIEAALDPKRYVPIGLSQEKSYGFFPPRGNSVSPPPAEALVRANYSEIAEGRIAA
jgi:DNA recombination-dependent growth factor C